LLTCSDAWEPVPAAPAPIAAAPQPIAAAPQPSNNVTLVGFAAGLQRWQGCLTGDYFPNFAHLLINLDSILAWINKAVQLEEAYKNSSANLHMSEEERSAYEHLVDLGSKGLFEQRVKETVEIYKKATAMGVQEQALQAVVGVWLRFLG
jgi:hypothetical protein